MKVLIIGGNSFVGLRLSQTLDGRPGLDLHILNRSGEVPGVAAATIHKGNRNDLPASAIDRDWDVVFDFVCFDDRQARKAIDHFTGVGRYIVVSSVSVYDLGADLREADFDALSFDLSEPPRLENRAAAYQDGKRRMEAMFAQEAPFPVVPVRFPFILGPDDNTGRLEFHVARLAAGKPIFVPNREARISLIHAADGCDFLVWAKSQTFSGPINVASPDPISLDELLAVVARAVGRDPVLAAEPGEDNASPYAPPGDMAINTDRLAGLGHTLRPLAVWLPELVHEIAVNQQHR